MHCIAYTNTHTSCTLRLLLLLVTGMSEHTFALWPGSTSNGNTLQFGSWCTVALGGENTLLTEGLPLAHRPGKLHLPPLAAETEPCFQEQAWWKTRTSPSWRCLDSEQSTSKKKHSNTAMVTPSSTPTFSFTTVKTVTATSSGSLCRCFKTDDKKPAVRKTHC